jgi:hypothetical protein
MVQASVTFDKMGVSITDTEFAPCLSGASEVYLGTCTFTGNGAFTFHFEDAVGNQGQATAIVDWIDKEVPEVTLITYMPATLTTGNVLATLVFNEPTLVA